MGGKATEHDERELKFDIPPRWRLPKPDELVPGGTVQQHVVRLETTYYDTAGRDLLRSRVTLRRRSGDDDTGWQLKVPAKDGRTEIRLPLTGRTVPAELRDATFGLRRRAVLAQVATLRTERHVHRLVDEDGTALAEIVVDEVTADTSPGWREVEVELIDGDADLLKRAGKWLVKNGATPSASASKLARALGVEATPTPDTRTLAGLVADYLDRQRAEIVRHDVDLRRGGDEIRSMRIATRRYRSVLRLLRDILDRERAERLDAELRWIAGLLGEVRDRQVLRERLAQLLEGLPDELFRGRVTAHVRAVLDQEKAQAEAALADAMRSRRYLHLLAELTAWHEQLPIDSDAPATEVARYLDDAERTVAKRSRKVPKSGDGRDEALHKVRKAAKRARYLAELSKPALGRPAKTARRRNKEIQKRLGERQDVVVTLAFLLRTGIGMDVDAFALGVLYDQARSGRIS